MTIDDPKVQAAVFGVAVPAAVGLGCAIASLVLGRIGRSRRLPDSNRPPRTGFGPAIGIGLAYAAASVGLLGFPDHMPRAMAEWLLPLMVLATLLAALPDVFGPTKLRSAALWLGRLTFIAAILLWPIASARENRWQGGELLAWHGGIAAWILLAFFAIDRVAKRVSPVTLCVMMGLTVAGLVPVVFGAGVTSHPQVSGGMAAGVAGVAIVVVFARGNLPLRAAGTVFIAWLTLTLLVSYQFVAAMAWWEFGVVASIPPVLAILTLLPKLRSMSKPRLGWATVAAAAALCGAVSAPHVPDLIAEMTGAGSDDPIGYDYGY